jgi:hypothetical protein
MPWRAHGMDLNKKGRGKPRPEMTIKRVYLDVEAVEKVLKA